MISVTAAPHTEQSMELVLLLHSGVCLSGVMHHTLVAAVAKQPFLLLLPLCCV
jgi:hypothetical protein